MDQSQKIILTPFNFFEWKEDMEILLRVKGLYRLIMETKSDPNAAAEKIKWHNVSEYIQRPPFPSLWIDITE